MRGSRILACLSLVCVAGCGGQDPDAAIRELIDQGEAAAEERDTGFFRDALSANYSDARGNNRDRLIALLRGGFLTHESIEVVTRTESVVLNGADAAEVVMSVGVIGRRSGGSLIGGLDGQLYRVELELVDDGGEWQIIGANWERSLE